jgi:hypothetical protein
MPFIPVAASCEPQPELGMGIAIRSMAHFLIFLPCKYVMPYSVNTQWTSPLVKVIPSPPGGMVLSWKWYHDGGLGKGQDAVPRVFYIIFRQWFIMRINEIYIFYIYESSRELARGGRDAGTGATRARGQAGGHVAARAVPLRRNRESYLRAARLPLPPAPFDWCSVNL